MADCFIYIVRWCATLLTAYATVTSPVSAQDSRLKEADSVVLERTTCFGTCPAYRLSVGRSGRVSFESRGSGERRSAADSVAPMYFYRIMGNAMMIDFLKLPDRISDDPHFCPAKMTDAPTATVTVFMSSQTKVVEDYHGCLWAPDGLRYLERYIDEAANSGRWVHQSATHQPPNTR